MDDGDFQTFVSEPSDTDDDGLGSQPGRLLPPSAAPVRHQVNAAPRVHPVSSGPVTSSTYTTGLVQLSHATTASPLQVPGARRARSQGLRVDGTHQRGFHDPAAGFALPQHSPLEMSGASHATSTRSAAQQPGSAADVSGDDWTSPTAVDLSAPGVHLTGRRSSGGGGGFATALDAVAFHGGHPAAQQSPLPEPLPVPRSGRKRTRVRSLLAHAEATTSVRPSPSHVEELLDRAASMANSFGSPGAAASAGAAASGGAGGLGFVPLHNWPSSMFVRDPGSAASPAAATPPPSRTPHSVATSSSPDSPSVFAGRSSALAYLSTSGSSASGGSRSSFGGSSSLSTLGGGTPDRSRCLPTPAQHATSRAQLDRDTAGADAATPTRGGAGHSAGRGATPSRQPTTTAPAVTEDKVVGTDGAGAAVQQARRDSQAGASPVPAHSSAAASPAAGGNAAATTAAASAPSPSPSQPRPQPRPQSRRRQSPHQRGRDRSSPLPRRHSGQPPPAATPASRSDRRATATPPSSRRRRRSTTTDRSASAAAADAAGTPAAQVNVTPARRVTAGGGRAAVASREDCGGGAGESAPGYASDSRGHHGATARRRQLGDPHGGGVGLPATTMHWGDESQAGGSPADDSQAGSTAQGFTLTRASPPSPPRPSQVQVQVQAAVVPRSPPAPRSHPLPQPQPRSQGAGAGSGGQQQRQPHDSPEGLRGDGASRGGRRGANEGAGSAGNADAPAGGDSGGSMGTRRSAVASGGSSGRVRELEDMLRVLHEENQRLERRCVLCTASWPWPRPCVCECVWRPSPVCEFGACRCAWALETSETMSEEYTQQITVLTEQKEAAETQVIAMRTEHDEAVKQAADSTARAEVLVGGCVCVRARVCVRVRGGSPHVSDHQERHLVKLRMLVSTLSTPAPESVRSEAEERFWDMIATPELIQGSATPASLYVHCRGVCICCAWVLTHPLAWRRVAAAPRRPCDSSRTSMRRKLAESTPSCGLSPTAWTACSVRTKSCAWLARASIRASR